jgi:hypothetical protein
MNPVVLPAGRQCSQVFDVVIKESIRAYDDRTHLHFAKRREGLGKFRVRACVLCIEL